MKKFFKWSLPLILYLVNACLNVSLNQFQVLHNDKEFANVAQRKIFQQLHLAMLKYQTIRTQIRQA